MKLVVFIMLLIAPVSWAQTQTYQAKDQQIQWTGHAAVGGYAPEGTLKISQADLMIDRERIVELSFEIDMSSLEQENKQLQGHLREEDFFDVNRYPRAKFQLSIPCLIEEQSLQLMGNMTIKSTTLEERVPVSIKRMGHSVILKFEHSMDRTRYGITYNSPTVFEKIKENAIADQFEIKGLIRFNAVEEHH